METLQDQIEYGRHCVHGTNIGTPGGADLLCGDCEMGWTWWVDSPRYGLYILDRGERLGGTVAEWSDPLTADDEYLGRAWAAIAHWAEVMEAAAVEAPGRYELLVEQTRSGYWDEPPHDAASHEAAGHEIPVDGEEGYCLTCYVDLHDRESKSGRMSRLARERLDTIEDIMATFGTPREEYAVELSLIKLLKGGVMSSEAISYGEELIAAEDERIASYR